jgi:hypothetical protein
MIVAELERPASPPSGGGCGVKSSTRNEEQSARSGRSVRKPRAPSSSSCDSNDDVTNATSLGDGSAGDPDEDEDKFLGMLSKELRGDIVRVHKAQVKGHTAFEGGLSLYKLGLNRAQLKCEARDNYARSMGFTSQFIGLGLFEDTTLDTATKKLELQDTEYERKIQV